MHEAKMKVRFIPFMVVCLTCIWVYDKACEVVSPRPGVADRRSAVSDRATLAGHVGDGVEMTDRLPDESRRRSRHDVIAGTDHERPPTALDNVDRICESCMVSPVPS